MTALERPSAKSVACIAAESFGLRVVESVTAPHDEVVLAMPVVRLRVKIDVDMIAPGALPDHVMKVMSEAQRSIFASVRDHIAKHDQSPHDRMEQIEVAAVTLLDKLGALGVPLCEAAGMLDAAETLRSLVGAKSGAVSWLERERPDH